MVPLVDTGLSDALIAQAQDVYNKLKPRIEKQFPDNYIVIDPISKEYWIDKSLPVALRIAKQRFPDRLFYTLRIGQPSAVTFSA